MPREAMPAYLSSWRLLALASPHLDARRTLLLGPQTSGIVKGADRRSISMHIVCGSTPDMGLPAPGGGPGPGIVGDTMAHGGIVATIEQRAAH